MSVTEPMNVFNNCFLVTTILILLFVNYFDARNLKRRFRNSSSLLKHKHAKQRFKHRPSPRHHRPNTTTERAFGFKNHVLVVPTPASYPWVASLQKEGFHRDEHVWRHKCTTSILNDRWTVTACHCVAYRSDGGGLLIAYYPGDHRVVAGTARLGIEPTKYVRVRRVEMFTYSTHCWKDNMYQSNYGGVKLKELLKFSQFIKPMEYVSQDRKRITKALHRLQKNKSICHVVGWGLTYINRTDLLSMNSHVSADQYSIAVQQKSDHYCDDTLCRRHPIFCDSGRSQSRSELCAIPLKTDSSYFPTSGSCLVCGQYSFGILSWVYGSDLDSPAVYFFSRFDKPFNFTERATVRDMRLETRSNADFGYAPDIFNLSFIYWFLSMSINT